MGLLIVLGVIFVVLGVVLLVLSYNKNLEKRTIEKVHKDFRKSAIIIGWCITAVGVLLILWGLAVKSRMIKKSDALHPANVVEMK